MTGTCLGGQFYNSQMESRRYLEEKSLVIVGAVFVCASEASGIANFRYVTRPAMIGTEAEKL